MLLRGRRRQLLGALIAAWLAPVAAAIGYPEISWDDLVPEDWDPMKEIAGLDQLGGLSDWDPRAKKLLDQLRAAWDNAPTVAAMADRPVRLPGYLVPLEQTQQGIAEFLLVPYFGACIHTPPPPANQIVHVAVVKPIRGFQTMDAVWVSGVLTVARTNSSMGASGYRMRGDRVVAYDTEKPAAKGR
ncbi:MAG: DUF3299 domain-containing protein [Lautropia sp.]